MDHKLNYACRKPQSSKAREKAKPTKRTKAPIKQQSSAKSKASAKKSSSGKRKAAAEESSASTDEQIEVNSTGILKSQQSKANHAPKKTSKASERPSSKSKERANDMITPKSPQVIVSQPKESLLVLARGGLAAIPPASPQTAPNDPRLAGKRSRVENSTQQNINMHPLAAPKVFKPIQPRAPVAQMSRAVIQRLEAGDSARGDLTLQTAAPTDQNVVSEQRQRPSEPRQIEDTSKDAATLALANIDPAILNEQHQASEPQPSANAARDASRQVSMDLGTISEQNQASESQQIQDQAPEPQQIDDATQDRELQASATVDQEVLPEEHQASEPPQVDNNRSKKSSDKPPKPSMEMAIEYQEHNIPEVEERKFCNRGLDWNEILQSREALLESKIKIKIHVGERMVQHWVDKCPLSDKGKKTIKILGRDPKMARMNSSGIVQNVEKYHTEPNLRPELVQADLYHLIIPRLIRHINTIYTQSSSDADDLGMLDSIGILLKALGELCDTAMHMEKHRDDHSGTELLGFEPKLNDALEQISDSSKRISERVDARRRFLRALQQKQRQDEANHRKEQQRAIQQREKEIRQQDEEIRQREEEAKQKEIQKEIAMHRRDREFQYQARLEAKQRAKRERSEKYWHHELPSSNSVLNEIHLIDDADGRVEQTKSTRKRLVSSSFVWTAALTDVLVDELRKYQDLDSMLSLVLIVRFTDLIYCS